MARRIRPGQLGASRPPLATRLPIGKGTVRAALFVALLAVVVAVVVSRPGASVVGRTEAPSSAPAPHIAALRAAPAGLLAAGVVAPARAGTDKGTWAAVAGGQAGEAIGQLGTTGQATSTLGSAGATSAAVAQTVIGPIPAPGELYPARLLSVPLGPDGELRPAAPLIMASYAVKAGDTLYSIAAHFGLQFGSIYWANKLSDPRSLHVGQVLRIPPVDGVVYTVKSGDTVESIAKAYHVAVDDIVEFNALTTDDPPAGEEIMIPDASGPALPKPSTRPATTAAKSSGSSVGTTAYHGTWVWPVPGGTISQYFHASHPALDIAAPMGTRVVAAAPGKVIYAGWGDNGGGYQVWISHGGNLYTTYNHMELVSVKVGQIVKAGQQVGRVGMTGWATGPHCHFEVWIGRIWDGGHRVNPLLYLR